MPNTDFRFSLQAAESNRALALGIIANEAVLSATKEGAELVEKAKSAVEQYEKDRQDVEAYAAEIEAARQECNDDLEIDDTPLLSVADEGVWVSAWVYVKTVAEESGD